MENVESKAVRDGQYEHMHTISPKVEVNQCFVARKALKVIPVSIYTQLTPMVEKTIFAAPTYSFNA